MKTSAKIIKLPTARVNEWIEACKNQDSYAQTSLYHFYGPVLMGICLRYMKNKEDAEDLLMESLFVIFTKIKDYKYHGSFEGWIKRITINQCLMKLRKNKIKFSEWDMSLEDSLKDVSPLDYIYEKEILAILHQLPLGYKTIFNLYVIEGYKHREIAEKLGISINTSKSQLILARKRLAQIINKDQKDEKTKGK